MLFSNQKVLKGSGAHAFLKFLRLRAQGDIAPGALFLSQYGQTCAGHRLLVASKAIFTTLTFFPAKQTPTIFNCK